MSMMMKTQMTHQKESVYLASHSLVKPAHDSSLGSMAILSLIVENTDLFLTNDHNQNGLNNRWPF